MTGTLTVNQASTTTKLISSSTTLVNGQAVTFTATIKAVSPGGGIGTGTVTFMDGTTVLNSEPALLSSSGVATFATSTLSMGSHSITAVYSGDPNFATSTSLLPLTQKVVAAGTTATSLTASLSSSSEGLAVQTPFNLTVSAVDAQGNVVSSYTGAVAVSVTGAPLDGSVSGTPVTGNMVNGTLVLSNLSVTEAGTYTLEIISGSLTTTITFTAVSPGRQT